jgi:predicted dehydrogenase
MLTQDDLKMVACCDLTEKRTRLCADLFDVPETYTDYYEMLERSDIDAVFILTGPGPHADFAVAAAEAGKHLLLQKPMATTMDDANRITRAVRETGVLALIEPSDHSPLDFRYDPVKELIDKGVLGDPYWFSLVPTGPDRYHCSLGGNPYGVGAFYSEDSGGMLFDYPYAPTQIVNVLGPCKSVMGMANIAVPDRMIVPTEEYDRYLSERTDPMDANYWDEVVEAERTQPVKMEAPDNAFSLYEMASGWLGIFHVGRLFHPVPPGLKGGGFEIYGTDGNCIFGHGHFASVISGKRDLLPHADERGWCHFEQPGDFSKAKWPQPVPGGFNYYEQSTRHFIDCIREGRDPLVNVEWGRHITEMMFGAIESSKTGKRYDMTTTTTGLVE